MFFNRLKKSFSVFNKSTTPGGKVITALLLFLFGGFAVAAVYESASEAYDSYRFNHLSSAEHLSVARAMCRSVGSKLICIPSDDETVRHLTKIPPNAPEYSEASKLLSTITEQVQARERFLQNIREQQKSERARLANQSEGESREQMLRNLQGTAHDSFTCGTSVNYEAIVSFDYGHYWWPDDGRCAVELQKKQEAARAEESQRREQEQKKRDVDAEFYSYWPTTIRVDTDIDSLWLNDEERTCQTYPDGKGHISVVACNATGSHRNHNIPVKFWGGVDRNTTSNWKCRRESDNFACRAID